MSRRAYVDVVVAREDLAMPGKKAAVRMQLYDKLATLGHVETIERYVMDPPDGPYRDGSLGEFDWDHLALIRVVGQVTPFRGAP